MSNKRLYIIFSFIFFLALLCFWRLFDYQIIRGDEFKAQARGQHLSFRQKEGERGEIYLSNGERDAIPVAVNKRFFHVYISPRNIEEKEDAIQEISQILSIDKEFVAERISRDSSYEILKRRISEDEVLAAQKIDYLHLEENVLRHYPHGGLASHVLGFVGGEGIGQYGIEQYYESVVSGRPGIEEGRKSVAGTFITRDTTQRGSKIILTLDYNIQYFAEKLLQEAHEDFNMRSASILVGDPNTGEILALANFPSFNPNHYSVVDNFTLFKNQTIQSFFEPGSIFKPITMAAALVAMAINYDDTYVDKGYERIHGRTIRNYDRRVWGEVTMTKILESSINTGIVDVERRLGHDLFLDYLINFGIFERTGIDLHGEVFSRNVNILQMYDINFANASFGHGIHVTTMQVFRAFSALANGGRLITPYVTRGMSHETGDRVISSKTSSQITSMLVSVVDNGSGWRAGIPGYYVAGKTGTAQIPWSALGVSKGGYSDETVQSFVGYAPAFNPRFLIIVKLDQPEARSSELSAAPIFGKLAKYTLDYMQIPPDYGEEKENEE